MKTIKWSLQKIDVYREGILDVEYSGYELQKDGLGLYKFSLESLKGIKELLNSSEILK